MASNRSHRSHRAYDHSYDRSHRAYDRSYDQTRRSHTPCEILSSGRVVFDEVGDDGIRSIGRFISLDDFLNVPSGIGGRVGVIPWFVANVIGQDGERRVSPMVRLCVTNHLYLSDMGGGFRANTSPYGGLEKELGEEVPTWKDEILLHLQSPHTFILALEQCAVRGRKKPIPIQFLIFAPINVQRLDQKSFQFTDEVRAIMDRTLDQFHEIVDQRPNIGSLGIRMYHLFRQHQAIRSILDSLFRVRVRVQEVEYQEADLVDEKVNVVLKNGVSTATFQELVRNNSNFSRNLQKAWPMREEYALQRMSQKAHKAQNNSKEVNEKNRQTNKNRNRVRGYTRRRGGQRRGRRRGIVSL